MVTCQGYEWNILHVVRISLSHCKGEIEIFRGIYEYSRCVYSHSWNKIIVRRKSWLNSDWSVESNCFMKKINKLNVCETENMDQSILNHHWGVCVNVLLHKFAIRVPREKMDLKIMCTEVFFLIGLFFCIYLSIRSLLIARYKNVQRIFFRIF